MVKSMPANQTDLAVSVGSLRLANPVMPASGTFAEGLSQVVPFERLGAMVTKTVTAEVRGGNPTPRVAEVACGMLNSIGLPSNGVDYFIQRLLDSGTDLRRLGGVKLAAIGAVAAGEDQPVILLNPVQRVVDRGPVRRVGDSHDRLQDHVGPQGDQPVAEPLGGARRSGHQDPRPGQRSFDEPRHLRCPVDHGTHDEHGRGTQLVPVDRLGQCSQRQISQPVS